MFKMLQLRLILQQFSLKKFRRKKCENSNLMNLHSDWDRFDSIVLQLHLRQFNETPTEQTHAPMTV